MSKVLGTISGFKSIANNTIDKISTIAGGALCLPSLVTTALLQPTKALTGVKNFVVGAIAREINTLKDLVSRQLTELINRVTGRIVGVLRQVQGLVQEAQDLIDTIGDLKKELNKRVTDVIDFSLKKKNCEAFAASISNCVFGRVAAEFDRKLQKEFYNNNPLSNITDSIIGKIDKGGNLLDGYLDKYSRQVGKANTQLSKVNNFATDFTYSQINKNV